MGVLLEEEVPLRGGRLTFEVVRMGETVRRPATAASNFVIHLFQVDCELSWRCVRLARA
jgi:hypothetical protein